MKRAKLKRLPAKDALTVERIRTILESPDVEQAASDGITSAIAQLFAATNADILPVSLDATMLEAEAALFMYRHREGKKTKAEREAYAQLAALVAQHEPEEYKVARRVVEIYAEESDEKNCTAGGRFIMEAADHVMSYGEGLNPNPCSEFFLPIFVAAVRTVGRDHDSYTDLKTIVARVDAGEGINDIAEEDKQRK